MRNKRVGKNKYDLLYLYNVNQHMTTGGHIIRFVSQAYFSV